MKKKVTEIVRTEERILPPKYMLTFWVTAPIEPPWGIGHVMRIIDYDRFKNEPETEAWCLEAVEHLCDEFGCDKKRVSFMSFQPLWG